MSTEPTFARGPAVSALYRYPVKGLTPDALEQVLLTAGETLPLDRAWAIENGPGRFDEANPRHVPKINFLMLMRDEKLATFTSRFDEGTRTLEILRAGRQVCRGDLTTKAGRTIIEQFLAAYMEASLRGPPRIVSSPGHSISDVAAKCLHIINLASVRELERDIGRPVDPLRFRPNIVLTGLPPWVELGWAGKSLVVADTRLSVFKRTDRCAATNVDPATGKRDMDIPAVLARRFGHMDFGVYARVETGGSIAVGASVTVETGAPG